MRYIISWLHTAIAYSNDLHSLYNVIHIMVKVRYNMTFNINERICCDVIAEHLTDYNATKTLTVTQVGPVCNILYVV